MKKKVLFISTTTSMLRLPISMAFEKYGYDVYFVDYRGHPFLEIGNMVHRALFRLPKRLANYLYRRGNKHVDSVILKKAYEIKPDLIFASKAKHIDVSVLDKLRTVATTANWYPETTNNIASINNIIRHYDYFFEFDKSIVDLLKNQGHKNVYHLPFCGDIDKNVKWSDNKTDLNIVFLGSYQPLLYPQRLTILEQIKDLGLNVWGNNAWMDTPLKNIFHGPLTSTTEDIKKLYARAKIVIHMDALTTHTGTGLTMRPFDVASAGAMLIAQDDRAELFDFFENGRELISFHDEKDIRSKVEYYLAHEDERQKIARAGFERTKRENTYPDRIGEVLDIVGSHCSDVTV